MSIELPNKEIIELIRHLSRLDGARSSLLSTIFTHALVERANQDEYWGGPEHDDSHSQMDWLDFIHDKSRHTGEEEHPHFYCHRMIQIVATAIAALESRHRIMERRKACLPNPGDYVRVESGFHCIEPGVHQVLTGPHGVYINCRDGQHLLDWQLDNNGRLIGMKIVAAPTSPL